MSVRPLSLASAEAALDVMLHNNFDADSRAAVLTFIRILDNILLKPADDKVRTLRLDNRVIQQKIVSRIGGLEFLVACGFHIQTQPTLLSNRTTGEERLVLTREDTQHLRRVRQLLQDRAVRDLSVDPTSLPPLPQVPTLTSASAAPNAGQSFNPYAGHRFDAKAHAAGRATTTTDEHYQSPVEAKLQQLIQRKNALERVQTTQPLARDWMALRPGQALPQQQQQQQQHETTTNHQNAPSPSDATLLAQRLRQQQQAAREREQFTTRAMRQVQQLERHRVYSHTTLTIQFPNGERLMGKFLPKETIGAVKKAMAECWENQDGKVPDSNWDLFWTPPRRVLDTARTLEQEGLVPAAKVFCSVTLPIRSELFAVRDMEFPVGHALAANNVPAKESTATTTNSGQNQKDDLAQREEALLQRMMGGKGLGGFKRSSQGKS